jgi:hypothetical protein
MLVSLTVSSEAARTGHKFPFEDGGYHIPKCDAECTVGLVKGRHQVMDNESQAGRHLW